MAQLITLTKKGPLGAAGSQVWVDDDAPEVQTADQAQPAVPAQDAASDVPSAS